MAAARYDLTRSCVLIAAALAAACSSTRLDGTWLRPEFSEKPIAGPVFVVAGAPDATVRRVYEDAMAGRLAERGVPAVRSYEHVAGGLDADATTRLVAAAEASGARYLLSTALIERRQEHVVTEEPVGHVGGYRRWYGSYWGVSYTRTEVRTDTVYVAQTSLTAVADDSIEWTARTRTTSPSDVEQDTRGLVDVVVAAMVDAGLVGPAQ